MLLWQWLQWLVDTAEGTAVIMSVLLYLTLCPPDFSGLGAALLGVAMVVLFGILCLGIVTFVGIIASSLCIANSVNQRTCVE